MTTAPRSASAVLVLALCLVPGCSGDGDRGTDAAAGEPGSTVTTADPEGAPVPGGTITVGLEAESNSWLPGAGAWAAAGLTVAYAIYDPLMILAADGTARPYLAESLVPNEDLTEYALTLREGVRFHDGTPLDAEAIRFNVESQKARGSTSLAQVVSFEVTGELTGVYRLARGNAAFPEVLTHGPGMPFSPAAARAMGEDLGRRPVGTGPFRLVAWVRDDRVVLERFDDYWQEGLPYLDGVTFRPIPDEHTRLQSLLAGDLDAMQTLDARTVAEALDLAEDGTIETTVHTGNTGGGNLFNTLLPPVDDRRVRLGLAHAVDQRQVLSLLGDTEATRLQTQYYNADSAFYSEAVAEAWPTYDRQRARELLQDYVDDPARSDDREPGSPIVVEYGCLPEPGARELSEAYQAFWEAVGVEVHLRFREQGAHIAMVIGSAGTDPPFVGEHMIACWRIGGLSDPYTEFSRAFGPVEAEPLNVTNYTSDTIDALVELLRTSADVDVRRAAVEDIGLELAAEVPHTFTGAVSALIANDPAIDGVGRWVLPDGTPGISAPGGVTVWSQVWRDPSR